MLSPVSWALKARITTKLNGAICAPPQTKTSQDIMQYKAIVKEKHKRTVHLATAKSKGEAIKQLLNALRIDRKSIIKVEKVAA